MEKEKIQEPFKYDTPTNIVEKEGEIFRGIGYVGKGKSLTMRIASIILSVIILIIPGAFLMFAGFGAFVPMLIGLILFVGGISAVYRNIKN